MGTVALSIKTGDKVRREEVACMYVGKFFAVHRNHFIFDKGQWQITHRPSGFCAGRGFDLRREAIEHAEWLEKRGKRAGVDWTLSDVTKLSRGKPWKELSAANTKRRKITSPVYPPE